MVYSPTFNSPGSQTAMDYCWTPLIFSKMAKVNTAYECNLGLLLYRLITGFSFPWVLSSTEWTERLFGTPHSYVPWFATLFADDGSSPNTLLVWPVHLHLEQVKWLSPNLVWYRILTVGDGVSCLRCVGTSSTSIGFPWVPGGVVVCSCLIGGPILLGGFCIMKLFGLILVDSSGAVW